METKTNEKIEYFKNTYTNSTIEFKDLEEKLSNDSNVVNLFHGKAKDKNNKSTTVMYAHFQINDNDIENITFYSNGGASIGTSKNKVTFQWKKFLSKEDFKLYIDNNSNEEGFKPYYHGENVEQKVGYDVKFLNRDSQTINMIQQMINKYNLSNVDFNEWGKAIHKDWDSIKKTHKNEYSWNDLYKDLRMFSSERGIAIVSDDSFCKKHKNRYYSVLNMYCAKANNQTSKFNKFKAEYKNESSNLLPRIENPQIKNKGLWYKIYHETFNGNWTTPYLPSSNTESKKNFFNESQIPFVEYFVMKDIFGKSENKEIKSNFFNAYKTVRNMETWEINIKNDYFKKVVLNNEELLKIAKFKKLYKKAETLKNERNNNIIPLSSFNRAPHCSNRPYFMKTKSGKLIRYESYQKYETARKYFKNVA